MKNSIQISLQSTEKELNYHKFTKQNLMTIVPKRGPSHDIWQCKCGLESKLFTLGFLDIKFSDIKKFEKDCPKYIHDLNNSDYDLGKEIVIVKCDLRNSEAVKLTPNSIHKIVSPPEEYKKKYPNSVDSVWVMGITEEVRLLTREFKFK